MRRGVASLAIAAAACSFETSTGPMTAGLQEEQTSTGSTGAQTSGGSDSSGEVVEMGTSGTTESAPTTDMPDPTTGDPGSTSEPDMPTSTTGPDVDCATPITISQFAANAEIVPPMTMGEFMGVPYAYSEASNSGEIRFSFEVECPSNYRLYGRVLDVEPSTNNCCDPDSYDLEGASGPVSWFYGCGTSQPGWTWVQVGDGSAVQNCDEVVPLIMTLSPGKHEFTLRNRESNYFEAHAGIAELLLTNDPQYVP